MYDEPYLHLIRTSPVLQPFADDPDPARLVRNLRGASSGERVMIAAALSLLPADWLPEETRDVPFRLADVLSLDAANCRALVEAVAMRADHPNAAGVWPA